MWKQCRKGSKREGIWQEAVERVLGEEGLGEGWMRELEEEREREGEGTVGRRGMNKWGVNAERIRGNEKRGRERGRGKMYMKDKGKGKRKPQARRVCVCGRTVHGHGWGWVGMYGTR